jgi:predicted dehydrogenase
MKNYNWVVIGCGVIAHQLAEALEKDGRTLYGVANRTYVKAVDFAKQYHIDHIYEYIDDVFEDENVDIVYISTPHNTHRVFLEKALNHGKHVLCEKSITLNSDELNEAIAYAKMNHVVLGEAMTIYHMPIYKKLHEIVASGTLGPLRMVQMNFGSYKDYDMNNRFFNRHLAGGALLDIGVYALSFMRYFMSEKPNQILSQVKKAPTGVDEQVGILLMNDVGEMATIALTLHAKQPKRGMLAFDQGYIEVYEYPRAQQAVITYTKDGHQEVINCGDTNDALRYEVHDMEEAVASGKDMLHLDYTKDVMDMMTELRQSWHFTYPEEE